MKKSYWALIIINGILFFILGVFVTKSLLTIETPYNIQFLDVLVGINTIMVTIAIALAAYKVITAKNVKEVVDEEISRIEMKTNEFYKNTENRFKELQNNRYSVLANSIENLIVITQEMAEKICNQKELNRKAPVISNMVDYTSELTKEIVSSLHMFVLTSSPDANKRLIGYQRLNTLDIDEIKDYFREKIIEEENSKCKEYLSQAL